MTLDEYIKKQDHITSGASSAYAFIRQCYMNGLCTYKEGIKAMNEVHKDCLKQLDELAMEDLAKENAYQMYQYN